jgi:hypothetical protein
MRILLHLLNFKSLITRSMILQKIITLFRLYRQYIERLSLESRVSLHENPYLIPLRPLKIMGVDRMSAQEIIPNSLECSPRTANHSKIPGIKEKITTQIIPQIDHPKGQGHLAHHLH